MTPRTTTTLVWMPACNCPACDWSRVSKGTPVYLSEDKKAQLTPIPGRLCGEFQDHDGDLVKVLAPLVIEHEMFVFRVTA